MTPEDRALDPSVFEGRELILHRIAKAEYANLSGVGASLYPGRWNLLGTDAIYTSLEVGTPVLERLVHTPKDTIPANLALMRIALRGQWQAQADGSLKDTNSAARVQIFRTLSEAKAGFPSLFAGRIAVAVPSVIVPAWNVVLYPGDPRCWRHVSLLSIEAFVFDPRLFPEASTNEAFR